MLAKKAVGGHVLQAHAFSIGFLTVLALLVFALLTPAKASSGCRSCRQPTEADSIPCLEAVIVDDGQRLPLKVVDGTAVVTGNTLVAEYGAVQADGAYVAPSFVPPTGLDTITLSDSSGVVLARTYVQVNATAGMATPGTFVPGMETSAPEDFLSSDEYSDPGAATPSAAVGEDPYASVPVEPAPQPLADVVNLPSVAYDGGTGYEMPMRPPFELVVSPVTDLRILVVGSPQLSKGRLCAVNPKPIWAGAQWSGTGTRTVASKTKKNRKGAILRASCSIGGGAFGFSGNITVGWSKQEAVAVRFLDVYRCKNGVWTYAYTQKCTKAGVYVYGFEPSLPGIPKACGYSGDPCFKFNPQETCNTI